MILSPSVARRERCKQALFSPSSVPFLLFDTLLKLRTSSPLLCCRHPLAPSSSLIVPRHLISSSTSSSVASFLLAISFPIMFSALSSTKHSLASSPTLETPAVTRTIERHLTTPVTREKEERRESTCSGSSTGERGGVVDDLVETVWAIDHGEGRTFEDGGGRIVVSRRSRFDCDGSRMGEDFLLR